MTVPPDYMVYGPTEDEAEPMPAPFIFDYTNWRGERMRRKVIPREVRFGISEWHKDPQWLMLAYDFDKRGEREFAMRDMQPVT